MKIKQCSKLLLLGSNAGMIISDVEVDVGQSFEVSNNNNNNNNNEL